LAIAICGLTLAGCGGGGGSGAPATGNGGSGSGTGTTQPGGSGGSGSGNGGTPTPPPPPPANPISMNIYPGTDYPNEPIVVVYINGKPVKTLLDTGSSGILVNQGTVPISQTAYTSQTFSVTYGDGTTASGTVAIATVCPTSSTVGCVTMPIAVSSQTSTSEKQGVFGMDCGYNTQGPNTFCYLYYLWQQNPSYSS